MGPRYASDRLAEIALRLSDASGLEDTCRALESGRLSRDSNAASRAAVSAGSARIESYLRSLQQVWQLADPDLSGPTLALVLRTSIDAVVAFRRDVPAAQVVWTGPKVEGSFLRATREVVREIVRGARTGSWWLVTGSRLVTMAKALLRN